MRALAILLALLVPTAQALAAMHLHCVLEHPLGRLTAHAAGEPAHPGGASSAGGLADHHHDPADHGDHPGHGDHGDHGDHRDHGYEHHDDATDRGASSHPDHGCFVTPFDDHHHHSHDSSSHGGCCIAVAAGALPAAERDVGLDVRTGSFDLPVPSGAYDSAFHEPPPRPQWRAYAPA